MRRHVLPSIVACLLSLDSTLAEASSCAKDSAVLSCHAKGRVSLDSCCYNGALVDGGKESGLILATQFWDANPPTGSANSTTIHGLWPDYCDGTYPQSCTSQTGITPYNGSQIRSIIAKYDSELLSYMELNYKSLDGADEDFWAHEWQKHGTCFNTLRAPCQNPASGQTADEAALVGYFGEMVKRFKAYPTYEWLASAGIQPSKSRVYTLAEISDVLTKRSGAEPFVGCSNGGTIFNEVWYYSHTYGPLVGAKYVPTDQTGKSTCKATGLKWLPKS